VAGTDVGFCVSVMSSTSEMIIGRVAGRLSAGRRFIYFARVHAAELVKY